MSTIILGNYFGLKGIILGYFALTAFSGLPWAYFIYNKYKKVWHT
jgi:uncharacterized iron-regulated membrane protein